MLATLLQGERDPEVLSRSRPRVAFAPGFRRCGKPYRAESSRMVLRCSRGRPRFGREETEDEHHHCRDRPAVFGETRTTE